MNVELMKRTSEDKRPFWLRLLLSLRISLKPKVHKSLKNNGICVGVPEFLIKGGADF
jgi:hypothetical protein